MDYSFISIKFRVYSHVLIQAKEALHNKFLEKAFNSSINGFEFIAIIEPKFVNTIYDETKQATANIDLRLIRNSMDIENALRDVRKILKEHKDKDFDPSFFFDDAKVLKLATIFFMQIFSKNLDIMSYFIETGIMKLFQPSVELITYEIEGSDSLIGDNDVNWLDKPQELK